MKCSRLCQAKGLMVKEEDTAFYEKLPQVQFIATKQTTVLDFPESLRDRQLGQTHGDEGGCSILDKKLLQTQYLATKQTVLDFPESLRDRQLGQTSGMVKTVSKDNASSSGVEKSLWILNKLPSTILG